MPRYFYNLPFLFFFFFTSVALGQTAPSIGDGSSGNPYQISTPDDFKWIAQEVNNGNNFDNKYFIQTNDIDFVSSGNLTPIGNNYTNGFKGFYDGGYHKLSNININNANISSTDYYLGIFGVVRGGYIKNVKISGANIIVSYSNQAKINAGILVGYSNLTAKSSDNNIENVVIESSTLSVTSSSTTSADSDRIGGMIGYLNNFKISKSYVKSSTIDLLSNSLSTSSIGGFAGYSQGSEITSSYFSGENSNTTYVNHNSVEYVGGFVGIMSNTIIKECFSVGNIYGGDSYGSILGGLVGYSTGFSNQIINSFSKSNIVGGIFTNGTNHTGLGGLIGTFNDTSISSCYATGTISPTTPGNETGGFAGLVNTNTVLVNASNFFNNEDNSLYNGVGQDIPSTWTRIPLGSNTFGKSKSLLKLKSTFENIDPIFDTGQSQSRPTNWYYWDFNNIWGIDSSINDGFPYLRSTRFIFVQSPELSISSSDLSINKTETATITFSISKDVSTFADSDISLVGGGTLSSISAVNSSTYTSIYTPPINFTGTVSITVGNGLITDEAGNTNTQTSTLVLNIDTIAPEISTLSHTHSDLVVRDANTVPFSVTFTEPMAISPKISIGSLVTNASMTISPSTNSQTWTYDWNVPSGNDGIVSATVSATDLFGNYYEGTDNLSFTIDNVSPTITLTENDSDDILLVGESTLFTASVNETVSGVPTMTIETTVGTTNDVLTAAGADWTYSYIAPSNYSGVVSFTVSLLDVAGNISTATNTLTVDSVTASLTLISSPNANGKYTDDDNNPANSDTISITLTFSEEVVVSSGTYPYLTLNTLPSQNAFYSGGSGTQTLTFSYMVMDGGETADLGVTNIVLPTGAFIKDLAGNPADLSLVALNASSDNLSDTKDIEIRAKDPTLTTLTAATNNGTTNFGATDGNTVTYNFTSDIDLLSSSVSMTFNSFPSQPTLTQSNSGNTYTLSFTVDANTPEGALQFNLFATDTHSSTLVPEENRTADYTQSAFNQTLIIDRTAPVITSTALTTPENSITGPTVVANEAVFSFSLSGGVDQALFTINPITGVLSFVNAPDFEAPADSNADNIYDLEVRVTDIVGLTATQTIAVTVTDVSDTFGVDLRATEVLTTEDGGSSIVSVALFTQPTAAVTLNFSSSDSTEGIPSLNQMVFTTDNWNIDQTLNMTGQDDQDIDGDVAYNLLVSSVSSSDANYNSLTGISLGFVNVDNEIDTDGDGFFDYQDAFPIDPLEWLDTDSDAIGNNADLDDDGDGFSDVTEITCSSNSLDATDIPLDSDGDGVLDCQDEDDDNDGIMDSIDNCQFTPNIDQIDTDGDGEGDVCDSDDDNDGYLDTEDAFPLDATEWLDTDQDGIGNNSDTDDDGDGQLDLDEIACGSDPLLATSISLDTDGDTIPDCVDTDDDNDGVEDTSDAFPLDPAEWTDTDQDGIGNNADLDDDNDGQSDYNELVCGSDPLDQYSKSSDIDSDSIPDCVDEDKDGDGYLNDNDAFPEDGSEWIDTDGDGLGDNFEVDDDNDGYLDTNDAFPFDPNEWADADNDGIGDNEDPDDNNDGFEDNKLFSSGALTPGSSGLESTWKVINIERYPNARVTIYNKNAQEVFSALGYKNDWRGTYKNSGDLLPAGSYYYIVDPNNGEKALTGWLFITY